MLRINPNTQTLIKKRTQLKEVEMEKMQEKGLGMILGLL